MFFGPVAMLYYLCFLLLLGMALFVLVRRLRSRPARTFFLLALSLMLWQLTLFLEVRSGLPEGQLLLLGRTNFAAAAVAAYFAPRFVREVAEAKRRQRSAPPVWLLAETVLLVTLTLLTPLVSAAEQVIAGHVAITTFGLLFPLYLLHVLGCLVAAVFIAFRERRRAKEKRVQAQLSFIGAGILATGGISLFTNALLPYAFENFAYGDVGTLSTLLFVLSVAWAVFVYRLFDLKVVLRKTLIYGLLLTFVLGAYSSAVFVVTQYLTDSAGRLVQFAVLIIAFSFDPLRRFLEEKADRLLFSRREDGEGQSKGEGHKKRGLQRGGSGGTGVRTLALLLPWRRE